ncbi:LPS export ABC transporter periplasmic protein LptC [Faecalibacter macacae]|uniref:LPS export ABC transporter periplasmic protein LptC n=1 Tax=Faecalibacter macacae TaxID=1859289 RepID=A0A3L9MBM9_9FLAO|nr:LPS export ABC transporter periplasmic protein LptC [Faecalibacter macacae]RLZ10465.1 LPS export ABC transporter periplasmic protein LptC [Faecalibacter macacae]
MIKNTMIKSAKKSLWNTGKKFLVLLPLIFALFSCDRQAPAITKGKKTNFPNRSLIDANIIFKDSGKVTMNLRSPLIEEYSLIDSPYTIFKKGLELDFFEKGKEKPGFFKADWGRLSDKTGIYEGRGNVIIITDEGDSVKSEQLFWDKNRKLIYSTKQVELIGKDGSRVTAKNGIEASDDLETYTLFNNEGYILMGEDQKF